MASSRPCRARTTAISGPDNRYSGFDLLPFDKEQGFQLVERMREIAAGHGASVAQVALAWLLAKPAVTSIILGASKPHQLDDNLGCLSVTLTEDEMTALDAATTLPPVYPNWFIEALADRPLLQALASR